MFSDTTTIADIAETIPSDVSGSIYWKYTDAVTISACTPYLLAIHSSYSITINLGNSLEVNGGQVVSQAFGAGIWYHLGFVYDQANAVHNIILDSTRFDLAVFPNVAGSVFEFKFGGVCGGVILKLFKVYKHLYSSSVLSLMRREDLNVEYMLVYIAMDEWGGSFFTEAVSGNQYQMDSTRDWADDSVASTPLCKREEVYSKSMCIPFASSLRLNTP